MADKEFIKLLDSNGFERLRFMIRTEKGEVMDVTVQYESYINDEWHNIVRYDCAHAFFHRDILSPEGEKEKQVIAIENLNDALLYSEQDFKDRWQLYKKRFMNKMRKK